MQGIELSGRVAVVTGAASGIGAASAQALAGAGAAVCCADRNAQGAELVAEGIVDAGGEAFAHPLDVTSRAANDALVATVLERYGALHCAHLNAGVFSNGPLLDVTADEWDRVMGVNLKGVLFGLQATAPVIGTHGGGSIIITSSAAGFMGAAGGGTYTATKHGVLGLMKCAAVEFAQLGIRVNAVCPGAVDTPILGPVHGNADALQKIFGAAHPIGRVGLPDEVGAVVAFLASDAASFMTGASVPIDGGVSSAFSGIGNPVNVGTWKLSQPR